MPYLRPPLIRAGALQVTLQSFFEERAAVFRDPRTQMVIAGEFGVSQTTISKIKRNGP